VPETISASQLVAYNLARVRKALGLSQEQAAARLEPYLGVRWSKAVYSAAERSYGGKRERQFTSAELAAFALAFGVPVGYFFQPPELGERAGGVLIGDRRLARPEVFDIATGGEASGDISHVHKAVWEASKLATRIQTLLEDFGNPVSYDYRERFLLLSLERVSLEVKELLLESHQIAKGRGGRSSMSWTEGYSPDDGTPPGSGAPGPVAAAGQPGKPAPTGEEKPL